MRRRRTGRRYMLAGEALCESHLFLDGWIGSGHGEERRRRLLVVHEAAVDPLKEDGDEEDRKHGGAHHATDHTGADIILAVRARARRYCQRDHASHECDRGHQDGPKPEACAL